MKTVQTLSRRIVMFCALVILGVNITGGIIYILLTIGKLTIGQNTSWINYFVTRKTFWLLPIELYIVVIALILMVVYRSANWTIVWSTISLAIILGTIHSSPYNVLLWIMMVANIVILCVSSASFDGDSKKFFRGLFDDIKYLPQRPALLWKIIAAIFAMSFILNYAHNEIIGRTSEEARDARLVEWYKGARNKVPATDGIELKIFTDYQCPACSQLVPRYIETALDAGNNAVQVGLYDFPLDTACNSLSRPIHPAACSAAYAARLMDEEIPNESHDFRMWLYTNRSELNDDTILQRLKEMGINNPQNMFDSEIKEAVRADILEAMAYGINAIPSIILNNVLLPAGMNPAKMELLLKLEMEGNSRFPQ